ncbi:hypothetical protein OC846_006605 [Tilletia horrida]|uniref:Uncharacterized protein n=1 Tax=Tilletia horrida TaxID=155126 RepID=A0AAN6GII8_9BASI|nr:hypothetical protein OC845_006602 [Tilletia horrida]KAK0542883.1 hypothetical protein OC846_006605 [Tilletia horrida]KAK0559469.1 hypothetical protein OC861_006636 [Tilletia horrida]
MALPRSAVGLARCAASRPSPSALGSGAKAGAARLISSTRPAQAASSSHQDDAHEEYPKEDFSSPFFRNLVIAGVAFGVVYKVSNINDALHASRASSSGKSSFQDAEHAEKTKPWLTSYIEYYTTPTQVNKQNNMLWLEAAQKTAETKLLTQDAERPPIPRLRYIGNFEGGSPHSIMPGSQVDLSDLKIKKEYDS